MAFTEQGRRLVFTRVFEGATAFRGRPASTILSVSNPNEESIDLTFKLGGMDQMMASGARSSPLTSTQNRTVPGKGRILESISDIFGDVEVSSGYVEVDVIEGVGAIGFELVSLVNDSTIFGLNAVFQQDSQGLELQGSSEEEIELFSAQLASQASDLYTSINLINLSSSLRTVTMTSVGDDGNNLADPAEITMRPGESFRAMLPRSSLPPPPVQTERSGKHFREKTDSRELAPCGSGRMGQESWATSFLGARQVSNRRP